MAKAEINDGKKIKIIVAREKNELPYVTVGVNGVMYQISRGEEVEVLPEVLEALKNAVVSTLHQETDETTGKISSRLESSPRIPFQILAQ